MIIAKLFYEMLMHFSGQTSKTFRYEQHTHTDVRGNVWALGPTASVCVGRSNYE